jgi:ATP-binding cassette subfamily B protein
MKRFKLIKQADAMNCGSTCLSMVARFYGRNYSQEFLNKLCALGKKGVSLLNISKAAEKIGFRTLGVKLSIDDLFSKSTMPCILHWENNHYVVAYKVSANKIKIADPQLGKFTLSKKELLQHWKKTDANEGFALLLEPTQLFFSNEHNDQIETQDFSGFKNIVNKVSQYKYLIIQLVVGLIAVTIINLIIPFLSQSLIDQGVSKKDLSFINLILIAQLVFIFSRTIIEFIRSWILLHISTRINISIMADFLLKLMRLPLSFFDKKNTGDILQRIADHDRIEQLLTSHSLNTLFSLMNLIVFGVVLWIYSAKIFVVFFMGSLISVMWPFLFLRKRKLLDNRKFDKQSNHQNYLMQLIHGMSELKINQAETKKKWQWEKIQLGLYKVKSKLLKIEQFQQAGTVLINEVKNIFILFIAAKLVIDGSITIGMLVAITYILGQLNAPIEQLLNFIPVLQDGKLSLQRLTDIQQQKEEDESNKFGIKSISGDIVLKDVSFAYPGFSPVLKKINLQIFENKTTAIVGESGSGKTTLLKLLLKFYQLDDGNIEIGKIDLENIPASLLREKSGVVFQDGYIFDDTIAENVALDGQDINFSKLENALKMANLLNDINRLPIKMETIIGQNGQINLSKGQQQRLMIARSIYKNPSYLFYDEATSALDANNEKVIQENLNNFLKDKTAVIIAHRLSTVKNADQIVVLKQGEIVETGNHQSLTKLKGHYYHLVKNQLELGA